MLLRESEGKILLRKYGIATPTGVVVERMEELEAVIGELSLPVVLKAQVPAGGRGKAGGVQFAAGHNEVRAIFKSMLGSVLNGFTVSRILIEPKFDIVSERYLGITLSENRPWLIIGSQGGVSIEDTAKEAPETLARIPLIKSVYDPKQLHAQFAAIGLPEQLWAKYDTICQKLAQLFEESDALMAEINPIAELREGSLMALDARIDIDDAALPRQGHVRELLGLPESKAGWGTAAKVSTLHRFESGDVGLVGLGGGMAMAVSDWFASKGFRLSGSIDMDSAIASGRAEPTFQHVFSEFLDDTHTKVILVNMIASGNRIDRIVQSLLPALSGASSSPTRKPVVVHLQGNGGDQATALLASAGYKNCASLKDALHLAQTYLK